MLKVTFINRDREVEINLAGRIDSVAALDVEKTLLGKALHYDRVILNFSDVDYISSAGLRLLKKLNVAMKDRGGSVAIKNVRSDVMDIFKVTGFYRVFQFL